jgi:23S rRNA pseudouridine1911/1915/1917 synthase
MIPSTDDQDIVTWVADDESAGERIDKCLVDVFAEDVSRAQIQQWIRQGHVTINSKPTKPNYRMSAGDEVSIQIPEPEIAEVAPEPIPLEIIYEDADVVVINKPRGMVVHPAAGHPNGTLVNALMYHCTDLSGINGVLRPGIVHRIDKDTSGLLVVAKNDLAHTSLSAQLKEHSVTRRYVAVAHGIMEHDQGTIDAPIGRDMTDRKIFTVTDRGAKHAVTHFVVRERFQGYTVLELLLETGRTHQIRVHLKFIGFPLVGDPVYGRSKGRVMNLPGQALHAQILGFTHPRTGERLTFEALIPTEMQVLIDELRTL